MGRASCVISASQVFLTAHALRLSHLPAIAHNRCTSGAGGWPNRGSVEECGTPLPVLAPAHRRHHRGPMSETHADVAFLDVSNPEFSVRSQEVREARERSWYARTP